MTEVFHSIQGEGHHAGCAAVFIRLAGCNYKCPWCDTDFKMKYQSFEDAIVSEVDKFQCHFIVITGGEPTIHDLVPLLTCLRQDSQRFIAIETNGTNPQRLHKYKSQGLLDWITVSPKNMQFSNNSKFRSNKDSKDEIENVRRSIMLADELKVVLDGQVDPNSFLEYARDKRDKNRLYIQPLSENMKPAVEFVMKNQDWRLSLQMHKILKMP
jgi:organic radical activating enzyme